MTLILTALTPNNIVQVADRCVTYEKPDGSVRYETAHNKSILFGEATIFSWTGRAEVEGRASDEWFEEMLARGEDPEGSFNSVLAALNRSFPPASHPLAFVGGTWVWDELPPRNRNLVPQMLCIANCIGPEGQPTSPQDRFMYSRAAVRPGHGFVYQLPLHFVGDEWRQLLAQIDFLAKDGGDDPDDIADTLVSAARTVADRSDEVSHDLMVTSLPRLILENPERGEDGQIHIPFFASRPTPDALCFSLLSSDEGEPEVVSPIVVGPRNWRMKDIQQIDRLDQGESRLRFRFMRGRGPRSIPYLQVTGLRTRMDAYRSEQPKVSRNDPCWCGSGRKYKKCHGKPI